MEPCCWIVGAGEFRPEGFSPAPEDWILAADGGFASLRAHGYLPHLLVGDFDSLCAIPEGVEILRLPVEKDDTDTLACAKIALERGFRLLRIFGGTGGGRIDHTLANLQTLAYVARHGGMAYLHDGDAVLTALLNGSLGFPAGSEGTFSAFAHGGEARGVTLEGFQYLLADAVLSPDFPLGVSNSFAGEPAQVRVRDGMLILCFPLAAAPL